MNAEAQAVELARRLSEAGAGRFHAQGDIVVLAGAGDAGWVVATRDGRQANPDTVSSAWSRFVKTRGLPKITLHGLRHSYATDLFSAGGEGMLKVVQERLGHADPSTTARIYLHVTGEVSDRALAEQEERIAAAKAEIAKEAQNQRLVSDFASELDAWGKQKRPGNHE